MKRCHEKRLSENEIAMCDTLAFLRLSLIEGFHITFAGRIWIICWKFHYVLIAMDELLRKSTGYNFLLWNLPPDWKQGYIFWCVVCTTVT